MIERVAYAWPKPPATPTERLTDYRRRLRESRADAVEEHQLRQTAGRVVLARLRRREQVLARLRLMREQLGAM